MERERTRRMARPREFDEGKVLDAAVHCFWTRGFDATSVRDLAGSMGITGASLYNAFGDKRALYRRALGHYVHQSVTARIASCGDMAPRAALGAFFDEVVTLSLADTERKGCMLINAAFDVAPHDPEFAEVVGAAMRRLEDFFADQVERGRADGTIGGSLSPRDMGRHLLGILVGVRVLARVRPERPLLLGIVQPALAMLDEGRGGT